MAHRCDRDRKGSDCVRVSKWHKDWTTRGIRMTTTSISKLIEKETAVKNTLKELRQDLKDALESSEYYKTVLETTLNSEYKPSEKVAKAHAIKVTTDHFSPKPADE